MIQWLFVFTLLAVESTLLLALALPLPQLIKKAIIAVMSRVWQWPPTYRICVAFFIIDLALFLDTLRSYWSLTHPHNNDDAALTST